MVKRLWQLGASQRWKMYLQVLGQWASGLLVVSLVWVGALFATRQRVARGWWWLIGVQLAITLLYLGLSRWLSQNSWAAAASRDLQRQFLAAYLQPDSAPEVNVMQGLQQDLGTLRQVAIFFETIIPTILELLLTGGLLVVVVLVLHAWTLVIPLGGILLLGMGMGMLQGMGNRQNLRYIQSFNHMGQRFLDDFLGMSTLIMYQRQHRYARDFAADSENFRQKTMGVLVYQLQSLTIMDLCLYGAIGYFFLGQVSAVNGGTLALSTAIGLGTLAAVWLIDFRKFGYFMHVFMSTLPKLHRLFRVIDRPKTPQETQATALTTPVTQVTLRGTLGYAHQPLVADAQLELVAGRLIGLTGTSGSGKSTLAQTLMQRLPLLAGTVTVNHSRDLTSITPTSWWQHAVYLGPNAHLIAGTIADNLQLGHPQGDWQARLRELDLCQFVTTLPAGYATPVGENGAQLSPGQRQQIAVARAILADKELYLFDEVTSNIDPQTADHILAVIQRLARTKPTLLITHRLADLEHLTHVALITDQQLISGSFAELKQRVPAFQTLVAEQQALLAEVRA